MIDHKKFDHVPFESLEGKHKLDAVDRFNDQREDEWGGIGSAEGIKFRLDGKVYVALEDPNDGYRSSMEKLFVMDSEMTNVFQPVEVLVRIRRDEPGILEVIDAANGKTVLEVGTDYEWDYYPSFVAHWNPENLHVNAIQDEAPHFMGPNEDCMGNPTEPYWRQFLKCSDGNYILGTGRTKEECECNAAFRRQEREIELDLAPEIRLRHLAKGDLCDRDMKEAIRLLIEVIFDRRHGILKKS